MGRVKILDIFVDNLEWGRVADFAEKYIRSRKGHQIITANCLMANAVGRDSQLKRALRNADLVVADSMGIVWASEFLGYGKIARVVGIDLMLKFCEMAAGKGYSVYLLGSHEFVLRKAAENLAKRFPGLRIAGMHHGYFRENEDGRILKEIRSLKPDFLFVGIGTPRGEKWIYQNERELNVPVCMGIGGSLDVISRKLKRAPRRLRQIGFEWTYRLLQEPRRIAGLPGLLCFVWKVIRQKLRR